MRRARGRRRHVSRTWHRPRRLRRHVSRTWHRPRRPRLLVSRTCGDLVDCVGTSLALGTDLVDCVGTSLAPAKHGPTRSSCSVQVRNTCRRRPHAPCKCGTRADVVGALLANCETRADAALALRASAEHVPTWSACSLPTAKHVPTPSSPSLPTAEHEPTASPRSLPTAERAPTPSRVPCQLRDTSDRRRRGSRTGRRAFDSGRACRCALDHKKTSESFLGPTSYNVASTTNDLKKGHPVVENLFFGWRARPSGCSFLGHDVPQHASRSHPINHP
jgi:hypothetical protein